MVEINSQSGVSPPIGSPGGTFLTEAMRKVPIFKEKTKIATWNVQGMIELGKAHNIIQQMKRLNVKILGISENLIGKEVVKESSKTQQYTIRVVQIQTVQIIMAWPLQLTWTSVRL